MRRSEVTGGGRDPSVDGGDLDRGGAAVPVRAGVGATAGLRVPDRRHRLGRSGVAGGGQGAGEPGGFGDLGRGRRFRERVIAFEGHALGGETFVSFCFIPCQCSKPQRIPLELDRCEKQTRPNPKNVYNNATKIALYSR